ncbi:MAG: hypothetical protein KAJ86_08260 [Alphaproteobacteria bacterium]|nr:hypothetical protein [Alphaproteobacteria bacterium]
MNIKDIIRDTAFIFFITFWEGFLISYMEYNAIDLWKPIISFLTGLVGFYFIVQWTSSAQIRHIFLVAILLWLFSIPVTVLHGYIKAWFISGAWTFSAAFLALGFSSLFLKQQRL